MSEDVLAFAQVMTVIMVSAGVFTAMFLSARALWLRGSRKASRPFATQDDGRMERLEAAVDAIAIEVERISEAQRFTVGLLTERLPARANERVELGAPGASKRVVTPH